MDKLRKELKQLRMENDILKQAALIIGRKYKLLLKIKLNIKFVQCVVF
ncbi:hypothetical protein SAP269_02450 [Spiroplasma ixodetis]|uniref:Transposase n=1 Tax=Spiroplasma ixodetis TaxID=2141 RepID=A0ABM8JND6_9MOLU